MHGGIKIYRGAADAARNYVEADRGRADDYYLARGTGIAERLIATPDGVRNDANAVRFAEVTVNGPKSWSLAAALHTEIAEAYDAAMDNAAEQIVAWLAQHSTTRVGGRDKQVQVPVERIEAAVIRHCTSRANDPHRHLHLQVNARVFAAGKWRGLHTAGTFDYLHAIHGIGHAAVMSDPGFRRSLAVHGFTLDASTGEIDQLAEFVGPFSARARQISRNVAKYESEWRADHPGQEPPAALMRAWDARAWADNRPDKVTPNDGEELTERWRRTLSALDYRPPHRTARVPDTLPGQVDRDHLARAALTRLGATRSAWNSADIRGEVEHLITRAGVVTDAAVRIELAEDLTGRATALSVPLIGGKGRPEQIRAWTSAYVLEVEGDIRARLAARADEPTSNDTQPTEPTQHRIVVGLAGDSPLAVLEGAAGTGKTTVLAAARDVIEQRGGRMVLVAPTLKAAQVAGQAVGAQATSAAKLARQHGWNWDEDGAWTRDPDVMPADPLRPGDVLLIDEAGMLDQDTARALLVIADEAGARVRFVGDRHQLPAVGRGGVLDLALRWAGPEQRLTLESVRRFVDPEYAELSLAMRAGDEPAEVFRRLEARGEVVLHECEEDRLAALSLVAVEDSTLVVADTREQAAWLNEVVHDLRFDTYEVDEDRLLKTRGGESIGRGDVVATRANDYEQGVANRDIWTVADIEPDGSLWLDGRSGRRRVDGDYARKHVELAYATTAYGAQGETVDQAHLALSEHTGAASAYVGMTRGRHRNVVHLVAEDLADAEQQWVSVFSRDRADLGPAHAAKLAAEEAAEYEVGRHERPLAPRRGRGYVRTQRRPAPQTPSTDSPSIGF